jgi:hypothetical protein
MNQESKKIHHDKSIKRVLVERLQGLKKLGVQGRDARFLALLVLLSMLLGVAIAQLTSQQGIASSGTIKLIGVSLFWDKACTSKVTSITWGLITPGTTTNKYVYVRNDGTGTGTLSMSYGNWTPTAAVSYFKLEWNCSSYGLIRNALVCAKLALTTQLNVTGVKDFNFVILLQAAG